MTVEPDMENLLASIRQAIDDDMSGSSRPVEGGAAAAIRGAMEELRARPGTANGSREFGAASEISELRNKINRSRGVPTEPKTPFAQIMAGQVKLPPAKPSQLPAPVQHNVYSNSASQAYQQSPAVAPHHDVSHAEYESQGYAEGSQPEWANEALPAL